MSFRTEISVKKFQNPINYKDKILFLGSCFSINMAKRLNDLSYQTFSNPTGITFNPVSILHTIERIINAKTLPYDELIDKGINLFGHFDFHSQFDKPSKGELIQHCNDIISQYHQIFKDVNIVVITLGTAYVYKHKETQKIVNNCHKVPQKFFDKILLFPDEITNHLRQSIESIQQFSDVNPRFIFTLSPVRHIKNGVVNDKRSKAHCLTAIHKVVDTIPEASYFPSYELLMDDLRDYRYYDRDYLHPSPIAVDYIFDKLEDSLLDPKEKNIRQRIVSILKRLNHKPFNPHSAEHQSFLANISRDIDLLKEDYPDIKPPEL